MRPFHYLCLTFLSLLFTACEDVVQLDIPSAPNLIVVEASLNDQAEEQVLYLRQSQGYFDTSAAPVIAQAKVLVEDNVGNQFVFNEQSPGKYVWKPSPSLPRLGVADRIYRLQVQWKNERLIAISQMRRVPPIDSIRYRFREISELEAGEGKPTTGYEAHFYANDPAGQGDCYRLKFYRNGKLYNGLDDLTFMYDGNFQKGAQGDGLMFILPIRRAISPELYQAGDKLKVELYSITEDQYNFYFQARLELNNAGLFARPSAHIPSNFLNVNKNSSWQGAGWFSVSALSRLETVIDPKKAVRRLF